MHIIHEKQAGGHSHILVHPWPLTNSFTLEEKLKFNGPDLLAGMICENLFRLIENAGSYTWVFMH